MRYFLTIFALLMTLVVACNSDETQEEGGVGTDGKVAVKFEIASRANTGNYVSDVTTEEKIQTYRVAFTTTSGRIAAVVDKTTAPTERDEFEVRLSPANYRIYAFANIPYATLDGLGITLGGTIDNATLAATRYSIPAPYSTTSLLAVDDFAGHAIPMTSLCPQLVEVTGRVTQTFGIEVVRLFAKLEFVFTNPNTEGCDIHSQTISNMTTNGATEGSILLMNPNEGRNELRLPANPTVKTLGYNYTTPLTVAANGGTAKKSFYVLESRSNDMTKSFELDFDVTPEGQSASVGTEHFRYALTDQNTITLIHRNDWIRIPVTLGDYELRLEALSYPPIGGYPEAEVSAAGKSEFSVKFMSGGDFVIRPYLRKYGTEDWFTLGDNSKVESYSIEVDYTSPGLANIFTKAPKMTAGEILGTLRLNVTGTVLVTLKVQLKPGLSSVSQTVTRKLYLSL